MNAMDWIKLGGYGVALLGGLGIGIKLGRAPKNADRLKAIKPEPKVVVDEKKAK